VHSSVAQSAHDMGMHAMTFHFGFEQAVLFQQWSAESVTGKSLSPTGSSRWSVGS